MSGILGVIFSDGNWLLGPAAPGPGARRSPMLLRRPNPARLTLGPREGRGPCSGSRPLAIGPLCMAAAVLGAVACGKPDDCEPGFDEGEQFRITVLANRNPESVCLFDILEAGDSVVLTGGSTFEEENGCHVRSARPEVPEFALEYLTECQPDRVQLGLRCEGEVAGCLVGARLGVGPHIDRSDSVVDEGILNFNWWSSADAPATCPGGCTVQYTVRIERLGMAPD